MKLSILSGLVGALFLGGLNKVHGEVHPHLRQGEVHPHLRQDDEHQPKDSLAEAYFRALKAGSGFTSPNSFSSMGLLVAKNDEVRNLSEIGEPIELWMGVGNEVAGTLVGHVTFTGKDVVIDLTDADGDGKADMFPFVIKEVHIQFSDKQPKESGNTFPLTRQKNPIPGKFEYNVVPTDPRAVSLSIPVTNGFKQNGAIHITTVQYGGVEGFNFYLPNKEVTLRITDYPSPGDPSYFKMQVTNGGFISTYDMGYGAGVYDAYCIDVDHTISLNQDYQALLFSSYEQIPDYLIGEGLIEYPNNLDLINWVINNFQTGDWVQPMSSTGDWPDSTFSNMAVPMEALTYGDIQKVIWTLIENTQSTSGIETTWSQYRVNYILNEVRKIGGINDPTVSFVPSCSQKIVFIVYPLGGTETAPIKYQVVIGQPVIGEIEVPCETIGGTAWGDGKYGAQFPGSNWATWFVRLTT